MIISHFRAENFELLLLHKKKCVQNFQSFMIIIIFFFLGHLHRIFYGCQRGNFCIPCRRAFMTYIVCCKLRYLLTGRFDYPSL